MERSISLLTFKGSISEAIVEAERQKKLFVVYISGEDKDSVLLEQSTWMDSNFHDVFACESVAVQASFLELKQKKHNLCKLSVAVQASFLELKQQKHNLCKLRMARRPTRPRRPRGDLGVNRFRFAGFLRKLISYCRANFLFEGHYFQCRFCFSVIRRRQSFERHLNGHCRQEVVEMFHQEMEQERVRAWRQHQRRAMGRRP